MLRFAPPKRIPTLQIVLMTLLLCVSALSALADAPDLNPDPMEHRRAEAEGKTQAAKAMAGEKSTPTGNQLL